MIDVKNIRKFLGAVIVLAFASSAASAQARPVTEIVPKFELSDLKVDYGVREGQRNGMSVKIAVSTKDANRVESYLRITVLDEDEEALEDTDGRFQVDGLVGTEVKIKPTRSQETLNLTFFVPYDDIEAIGSGEQLLILDFDVMDADGELYQHLGVHEFLFTVGKMSSQEDETELGIGGVVSKIEVKNDIVRDSVSGVLIRFTVDQVTKLKDVEASIAVRFLPDGDSEDYIQSALRRYADTNGDLIATFPIKAAYDPAKFSDVEIFVPYAAFPFKKGNHKVEIDIDILVGAPDDLLVHLGYTSAEIRIK